jgi:hypothetical protein
VPARLLAVTEVPELCGLQLRKTASVPAIHTQSRCEQHESSKQLPLQQSPMILESFAAGAAGAVAAGAASVGGSGAGWLALSIAGDDNVMGAANSNFQIKRLLMSHSLLGCTWTTSISK